MEIIIQLYIRKIMSLNKTSNSLFSNQEFKTITINGIYSYECIAELVLFYYR
ncbi:MAG: hypothetical protein QG646_2014 [Euryarchaeota archaeon]|nr:hypothetical protein [Euryarchaeota archaeon]